MDTSLNISNSGIRVAQTQVSVRSDNIANLNTQDFKGSSVLQSQDLSGVKIASINKTDEDLVSDVTSLLSNKSAHSANSKVVKVQNQMLGTIIDLVA